MADIALHLARAYASLEAKTRTTRRALIIPPAASGSLGDAAMITGAQSALRSLGFTRIDILCEQGWSALPDFEEYIPGDEYFYHGSRRTHARLIAGLGRYSHAFFLGADVVDGAYNPQSIIRRLEILRFIADQGRQASILGCSFNEIADLRCIEALKSLPLNVQICARDPVSYTRMAEQLDRPITLVADLAFLVDPAPSESDAENALSWIAETRKTGMPVVALNANYILNSKFIGYQDALTAVAKDLTSRGVAIVTVPHDMRTKNPDAAILQEIIQNLPKTSRDNIYHFEPKSPGAVKAVLQGVDIAVTGRMHVAILAMGVGTPALSFGYHGKFEGLLELLKLKDEKLLYSPSYLVEQPENITQQVLLFIKKADRIRDHLNQVAPEVRQIAMENFKSLSTNSVSV